MDAKQYIAEFGHTMEPELLEKLNVMAADWLWCRKTETHYQIINPHTDEMLHTTEIPPNMFYVDDDSYIHIHADDINQIHTDKLNHDADHENEIEHSHYGEHDDLDWWSIFVRCPLCEKIHRVNDTNTKFRNLDIEYIYLTLTCDCGHETKFQILFGCDNLKYIEIEK